MTLSRLSTHARPGPRAGEVVEHEIERRLSVICRAHQRRRAGERGSGTLLLDRSQGHAQVGAAAPVEDGVQGGEVGSGRVVAAGGVERVGPGAGVRRDVLAPGRRE
ncbi:hypothetical protein [Propioniciclava sinopodophylli]|uniref:hypothetical protein n=1 Tax=Propioniciclava sinopodophylli TaxID=1837344 RepID=UPI00249282B3|nr:hypothetical protein [Propioniciclava sinopodophylli]